jgi:hypothetical protein
MGGHGVRKMRGLSDEGAQCMYARELLEVMGARVSKIRGQIVSKMQG